MSTAALSDKAVIKPLTNLVGPLTVAQVMKLNYSDREEIVKLRCERIPMGTIEAQNH